MKKFNFKWLLLSIILSIASIPQMWAGTYLKGSFDSWGSGSEFVDGVATLEVNKVDSYQFKILNNDSGDKWTGAGSSDGDKSITSASTSVTLSNQGSGSNVGFVADVVGTYIFTLSGSTLTVTYPTARTYNSGQKIYLKDVSSQYNWGGGSAYWGQYGNVYAYFSGDGTSWSAAATVASGSAGEASAIYEITVPSSGKKFTSVYFARGSSTSVIWNRTTDQSTAIGYNCFYISTDATSSQYKGSWGRYAKNPSIIGNFNNWDPDQGFFTDGRIILDLEASTDYTFKVLVNEAYCGVGLSAGTITNTLSDWWKLDGSYNVALTSGEEGEYCFHWDAENYKLGVYYPQARFSASQYIYFNMEGETGWKDNGDKVMFWTKYYDSNTNNPDDGISCNSPLETYVYYAQIPSNDYIGKVQLNLYDGSTYKSSSSIAYAYNRTSSTQNCMIEETGKESASGNEDWTPQWTTYCPPTKEETLSDNSSSIVPGTSGTGTSGNPILVIKGTKLKVAASANKSVADGNMTIKYDFKVNKTSQQDGTSGSYSSYTASTNNAIYKVSVDAYTNYKLDDTKNSTKHTPDTLYYKALNEYTIKYYGGTNAESGSHADDKQYHGIAKTLPGATFTRANYTQTGWTTSDGGAKVYDLSTAYTANTNLNLYPVWTEVPYDITATASEGGSVGAASYTGKVVTTCAISATPNTGYKFSHWSVESGDVTFADQYSASTTMNATSDAEIKANFVYRWSIAGSWLNYPETENWDADTYYMGNIGTNASSKDTCYVEISLAANTSYTFDVVDRSTSPYTFHKNGNDKIYYMTYGNSTNWGFGTTTGYNYDCGITTAGAGTYKFAYNITDKTVTVTYPNSYTVTFGYGTGGSAVTASVEDAGSINSGDYATAGKDITFTKTAANLAYTFKGWYNASSDGDAISCMASDDVYDDIAANISVYAQFKTRYGLHGSLIDDNAGGMPGWAGDGDDFVVRDYTDIGEGDGKGVELKCWRVLEPNREYKFRVQDRAAGSRWGLSESAVLPAEGVGSNVKLSTYGDENGKDVFLYTVGEGEYVFHITNMYDNNDGKYYPAIQVDRPASSQLTMGVYDSDHGSLSASSYKNNTFAITDGQFYANGSTLTFHATPNTGYHVEGWYSDASCETPYVSGTDGATICDPGDVSLVLSNVSTNKTVYVKFAEDENTLTTAGNWNTAGNWSAGHIPTINEVVYLPKAVTVDIAGAKAKRVRIQRDGETYTGKLTISATGGLVVAEDIKAQHEADGAYEATTKEDLRIETSNEGNGGLITGNACEGNNAEYEFYTKAYKYSFETYKFYINQYIGIPFVSMEAYKLYGFNIFVYDDGADDWRTPGSTTMEAWKAYDLIRRYENDDWSYFNLDGELNLPGKSATKTFTCSWRGIVGDPSIDEDDAHEDYLFANSWTAPISIKDITASNCSGTSGADLVQTIYIFNAGYEGAGQKSVGTYAGTWSSFPLASSSYMANAVIPATQAFMVTSKKGSTGATLTLSYNDHVYKPAIDANQINTSPTRAPRRTQANDDPNILRIIVRSSDVDADQLYVFERGDFSFDFDDSWDGNKILGESFAPQLYALSGSNKMAVNAVPDMEGMKIGFKAGKYDNQYTFSFEYADDAETLYLYDTDTQEYTQISSEATYSFTTSDTKEHERFVITRSKAPQIVTGVDGVVSASDARKQMINGTLYIIRDGRMYNAEGALVK